MRVSVILSTYNSPEWLQKALWGWAIQSDRDFELVIADDGSDKTTRQIIDNLRAISGLSVKHVWHEHQGFGKCRILNRAIEAASGEYLIFSDGDCIPRQDFVQVHRSLARPRRFLSGGYVKLTAELSHRLQKDDVVSGAFAQPAWLVRQGLPRSRKLLQLWPRGIGGVLLDALTTTRPTCNGHNMSAFKRDILAVNGFDERMQWGGLDRELGERLQNAGIKGWQIRHRTVCLHLHHAHPYADPERISHNQAIREQTRRQRRVWTAFGVRKEAEPVTSVASVAGPIRNLTLRLLQTTKHIQRGCTDKQSPRLYSQSQED